MSLAGVNLNHLVALDALLAERSVGKAAERVGVTQSAMSHTLRSLREITGDALLVRSGNAMIPTPFAQAAQQRLSYGPATEQCPPSAHRSAAFAQTADQVKAFVRRDPARDDQKDASAVEHAPNSISSPCG